MFTTMMAQKRGRTDQDDVLQQLATQEEEFRVMRQLNQIPFGVETLKLEELLDKVESTDRVQRYARSQHAQAKNEVQRAAWSCLQSRLDKLRASYIARAEEVERKRERLRYKGGQRRRSKSRRRRTTPRRTPRRTPRKR